MLIAYALPPLKVISLEVILNIATNYYSRTDLGRGKGGGGAMGHGQLSYQKDSK